MELLVIFVFVFPPLHVLISSRSHGGAKFAWFILALAFNWITWVIFMIVTQHEVDARNRNG